MDKNLPHRPNLDHLRRQAKSLLAALAAGDADAAATMREHVPAAKGMSAEKLRASNFRLADAQSAIARQTGFASWPKLARYVEQLRAMEGTWEFVALEIDGRTVSPAMTTSSRILMDGDRFRTESPEATYEGVFGIDVEAEPHHIDIDFVAGPEAGNRNMGIFRLNGDALEICLDMTGRSRPTEFRTTANSGHACEVLRRASPARPHGVTGGTAPPTPASAGKGDKAAFAYVSCPMLDRLQGEWAATRVVRDGQALPKMMLDSGRRVAMKNEIEISFGGKVMIHALVRVNDGAKPAEVDYLHIGGQLDGVLQLGIMEWRGDEVAFCMAPPGQPRPADFECPAGSGRTLSQWRRGCG